MHSIAAAIFLVGITDAGSRHTTLINVSLVESPALPAKGEAAGARGVPAVKHSSEEARTRELTTPQQHALEPKEPGEPSKPLHGADEDSQKIAAADPGREGTEAPESPENPKAPGMPSERHSATPSHESPETAPEHIASLPAGERVDFAHPDYALSPRPPYPPMARKRGYEGTVFLMVLVRSDGSVGSVTLERSSGHEVLDTTALEAVRGWVFVPALRGGEAVESWVTVPLSFRLRQG